MSANPSPGWGFAVAPRSPLLLQPIGSLGLSPAPEPQSTWEPSPQAHLRPREPFPWAKQSCPSRRAGTFARLPLATVRNHFSVPRSARPGAASASSPPWPWAATGIEEGCKELTPLLEAVLWGEQLLQTCPEAKPPAHACNHYNPMAIFSPPKSFCSGSCSGYGSENSPAPSRRSRGREEPEPKPPRAAGLHLAIKRGQHVG